MVAAALLLTVQSTRQLTVLTAPEAQREPSHRRRKVGEFKASPLGIGGIHGIDGIIKLSPSSPSPATPPPPAEHTHDDEDADKGKSPPEGKSFTRDGRVTVTADTRGNLGPASVVVQDPPGQDWIKDRWQAASDMGGTAIPGSHWVQIDLGRTVRAKRAVLDWEAAYADDYEVSCREDATAQWLVLFDAKEHSGQRTTEKTGKSPGHGVDPSTPLHVIHTYLTPI